MSYLFPGYSLICCKGCGRISRVKKASVALSATRVWVLSEPGRCSDGSGLLLSSSRLRANDGACASPEMDTDLDIGLGEYQSVSLARAREKATEYRTAIAEGWNPMAEKRAPAMPTFREAAHAVNKTNRPRSRNARHAAHANPHQQAPTQAGRRWRQTDLHLHGAQRGLPDAGQMPTKSMETPSTWVGELSSMPPARDSLP